jgi:hypothetical protein
MENINLSRYDARNLLKAGWAVRTITASVMLMMAVLAPVHLTQVMASPLAEDESMAAVVELADFADERQHEGSRQRRRHQAGVLAAELLAKAQAAEPEITAVMQSMAQDGAYLAGLDNRFKDTDSLAGKIFADAEAKKLSLPSAAAAISDVLRYTLIFDASDYSERVPQTLAQLTAKGYRVEKFRNAWGGKFYQGINTQLISPQGMRVELQFHTAQSYAIKQASHEVYEIRRNPASAPAAVEKATQESIAYNQQVIVPVGGKAVTWPQQAAKVA